MASTSCVSHIPLIPMKEYPPPLAKYEEVTTNPKLFMLTLEKLHASMGTKFMIPIIGGKELDLCRLFLEVTSRGGIEKIIKERRWKEVTSVFNFPSTATNASFVLRKYYSSLLYHYEQIYYFKANQCNHAISGSLQNQSTISFPNQWTQFSQTAPEIQSAIFQQSRVNLTELSEGSQVIGLIDGKFESGYLVTVSMGFETLNGVLYDVPQIPVMPSSHYHNVMATKNKVASASLGVHRRRRRKKSEIKRRDPSHPKPNRSGYNFFFAEQHARLKPLHQAKDREISRIIGELWNKLKEPEKQVYQEKAIKDKERYKAEMEEYCLKLKTCNSNNDAMQLQQRIPELDKVLDQNDTGSQTPEDESGSSGSDYEYDKGIENDTNVMDGSYGTSVCGEAITLGLGKSSKEDSYESFHHCEEEVEAGHKQVQKMGENQNMLSLL
ncbi:putative transcription factor & chromatin remodeling ARID-HMG family [Lupinus albus]|uniref:Putative transcription factor & chromatin remodeling ARID-HMG family n=1 Tax=Lupinus albus TaxID=3870 RepID=A0A6A4PSY1_LUPAL|nr:putative transcription factor & chromatin remodeling ARID-HMG family [Lupinus albus]